MALVKLRLVLGRIDKRRDKTPAIRNHKLQRRRRRTLIMSSTVIGIPDQHAWDAGIHARSH